MLVPAAAVLILISDVQKQLLLLVQWKDVSDHHMSMLRPVFGGGLRVTRWRVEDGDVGFLFSFFCLPVKLLQKVKGKRCLFMFFLTY